MAAASTSSTGSPAAVLKSLQAGADVALWITTAEVPAVLDRLEQAVAAGELSQAAVDASVQRVAAAKGLIPTAAADHPYAEPMAGGTKRLPRAVREQQMLDAAVQMFSINGYHETSMDAIAAEAQISKPMLYLYYGSKEELFGACLDRELNRFVDEVRGKIDFTQSPKDMLSNAVGGVPRLYRQQPRIVDRAVPARPPVRRRSRTPCVRAGTDHRSGRQAACSPVPETRSPTPIST